MQKQEQEMVKLLTSNYAAISKGFKLETTVSIALGSLVWTLGGRQATTEEVRASFDYLKSKTSALSSERYTNKLALVSRMAMSGNPEAYLAEVQRVFARIMEGKKIETGTRFGTALLITEAAGTPERADELVDRTKRIFERMREVHPVITDDRDMTFAAIVALSDRDDDELLNDAEECYQLLGDGFKLTGGRQTMAFILSLSPLSPAEKVAKVKELREAFRKHKISIGWTSSQEFATLALLALDERDADEIAADVAEVHDLIRKQKGFGTFSISGAIRLLFATAIATSSHQSTQEVDAISGAIALAVMQALIDWLVLIVVIM